MWSAIANKHARKNVTAKIPPRLLWVCSMELSAKLSSLLRGRTRTSTLMLSGSLLNDGTFSICLQQYATPLFDDDSCNSSSSSLSLWQIHTDQLLKISTLGSLRNSWHHHCHSNIVPQVAIAHHVCWNSISASRWFCRIGTSFLQFRAMDTLTINATVKLGTKRTSGVTAKTA